jgi:ATP-dependent helicase HrpB
VLGRESGVHEGEFLVALDVAGGDSGEPIVRQASRVEPDWLVADGQTVSHRLEDGRVRAVLRETLGALLLAERHVAPDPVEAARLLAAALRPTALDGALARRLRFAGLDADLPALLEQACLGATELRQVDLGGLLPHAVRRELDRLAPERLPLPSGRTAAIEYREDGAAVAEAKLQELFGLAQSPRLGPRQEPVLLALLAPNGRPVQLTRDLRSFWERTYPEVRKELRGRYPRHPWPDDPWTAEPTHRAKRRE